MTAETTTNKKTHIIKYIAILLGVALILACSVFFISNANKRTDLNRLKSEAYNSVFFSMYDISNYKEEDFATYRGLQTLLSSHTINSLSELSEYLDAAFLSDNALNTVYIGFDPYLTYSKSFRKDEFWRENLAKELFCHFEAHPEVTFEVLLPYPSLDTWAGYSDKKTNTMLATYQTTVALFSSYNNVICHFVGTEEWLVANPDNYTDDYSTNKLISCELLKHVFCDRRYPVNVSNAESIFGLLRENIANHRNNPKEYPDLSDMQIVFFGDSIIGNHNGSYSIPGIMQGLTDANVYNFAIGGTNASRQENEQEIYPSFITRLDDFLAGTIGPTQDDTEFPYQKITSDEANLCFIIHYGFNDFMWNVTPQASDAQDVSTFEGALRTGIADLKEAYPNASVLLVAPQLCTFYAGDTEITNESGYTFDDYLAVIESVAADTGITLIDMPSLISIDETNYTDYYVDSFHHSEQGRFVTANHWIDSIATVKENH